MYTREEILRYPGEQDGEGYYILPGGDYFDDKGVYNRGVSVESSLEMEGGDSDSHNSSKSTKKRIEEIDKKLESLKDKIISIIEFL